MEVKSPAEIMADEHLKRGNEAYEAREYLMAVHHFSEALKLVPSLHTAYYNRSAAHVALKRYEEALNDAHLVTTLAPSWTPAFARKGYVLWCMGEIGRALEAYEMGNAMDPHDEETKRNIATLQSLLKEKEMALHMEGQHMEEEEKRSETTSMTITEDFECVLCLKIFYEPVTTPCGHTFCRTCLFRAMDHGTQCPLCRGVVHLSSNHPTTVTLKNIIKRFFPDEYRQREEEAEKEIIQDESCMPLFPLNAVVFPGMRFPMHIFEPRYRLMLRRCMAGAKTFGLINIRRDSSGSSWVPYDMGCTLEINKINIQPDGRSYIDTRGKRRFRVLEKWEMDGYLVGKIQYIDDPPVSPDDDMLRRHVQEARSLVNSLMTSGLCESNEQIKRLITQAGDVPTDDLQFSYWLATILPVNTDIKQELLEMTNTSQRYARILDVLRIYFGFSYNFSTLLNSPVQAQHQQQPFLNTSRSQPPRMPTVASAADDIIGISGAAAGRGRQSGSTSGGMIPPMSGGSSSSSSSASFTPQNNPFGGSAATPHVENCILS